MSASGPPPGDLASANTPVGTPPLASGKTPKSGVQVVGRERELDSIRRLLDDARAARSGALLLVGEAGIGKSTLLESAREMARDFTCLTARGVESESVLAYAGLLELLNPVRHLLDEVPEGQADALRAALGWAAADAPADRFLVGAATLSLLAVAAVARPVLVLVDDLHWLDRESASAIAFAARRLNADAVAFVLNARPDVAGELVHGLPVLEVSGLSLAAAALLVTPGIAAPVTARLATATQGNPLALLEVSRQLTPAQRLGAAPLPDPLPVGNRLQVVYEPLLTSLSAAAWRAVLLLALDRTGTAAKQAAALDEAVVRGVVAVDEQGYRLRHPLLRAAALRLATPAQRREAHRTLAASLPTDAPARAWHLAGASLGPDDGLADELARVADGDRLRLGYAAASAALERSAVLTEDPAKGAERLAAAAEDAFVAGDLDRTRALVDRVLSGSSSDSARGRALFTLGMVEQYAGSVPLAADHLSAACAVLDGEPLVRALTELALAQFRLNDFGGLAECAERIEAAADLVDPEQRLPALFVGGVARALVGDYETAMPMLTEVTNLALSEELRHNPRALLLMALAAGFSGTVAEAVARGASARGRSTTSRRRRRTGADPRDHRGRALLGWRPRWCLRRRRRGRRPRRAPRLRRRRLGGGGDAGVAVGGPRPPRRGRRSPRPGPRPDRPGRHDQRRRPPRASPPRSAPCAAATSPRSSRCSRPGPSPTAGWARWVSPSAWRRCWSRPTSASAAPTTRSS